MAYPVRPKTPVSEDLRIISSYNKLIFTVVLNTFGVRTLEKSSYNNSILTVVLKLNHLNTFGDLRNISSYKYMHSILTVVLKLNYLSTFGVRRPEKYFKLQLHVFDFHIGFQTMNYLNAI